MVDLVTAHNLPNEVLSIDKAARFCAVVDKFGHIQSSKYRETFRPILTDQDTERLALLWTIRYSRRQSWEERLGERKYTVTRYDNAIRAVIPMKDGNHIVLVSFDTNVDNFDSIIMEKILPLIEEYSFQMKH
jgi:hypothetical protein